MQSGRDQYTKLLSEARSLVDIGRHRAQANASQIAYDFLTEGETEQKSIDYHTLDQRARAIAATLQMRMKRGDRVLLVYPAGLEFIEAFLGCLYAGIVAVPAYPPQNRKEHWIRLVTIARAAGASALLTTSDLSHAWARHPEHAENLKSYTLITTDTIDATAASSWQDSGVSREDLAFLQFTSGSTGTPKGVMVSHRALLSNELLIAHSFRHKEGVVMASWLPVYHDMGLIGSVLQPYCLGGRAVLMPPLAFLQKPFRWLAAISRHGACTSGAPNFAYELCVNRVTTEQKSELNLSGWTLAFNGAEPVRADTLRRFADAFAICGFRYESFYPCYGLAEATLFASGSETRRQPVTLLVNAVALEHHHVIKSTQTQDTRELVSSGSCPAVQSIKIVNHESQTVCPDLSVGEIWIRGASVADGYWGRDDETRATFQARITNEGGEHWLRTGDLGFMDGGELFVTGRIKDMIIVRGRNLYPHDVESAVQEVSAAFRPGCGAAFSVEINGEERLVIVQEIERNHAKKVEPAELRQLAVQTVGEVFGTQVHDIVFIRHGSLVKTSSGKIERQKCKRQYQSGELSLHFPPVVAHQPVIQDGSRHELLERVRALAAHALQTQPEMIDAKTSLMAYGMDSLAAIQLHQTIESQLHARFPIELMLSGPSLETLIDALKFDFTSVATNTMSSAATSLALDATGLSLNQKALWTLYQLAPASTAYNVALALHFDEEPDFLRLEAAIRAVMARHEALRTIIQVTGDVPMQTFAPVHPEAFKRISIDPLINETTVYNQILAEAKTPFELAKGPLFRATLFERAKHGSVLLLTAHHIVIDMWSLAQVVEELAAAYGGEDITKRATPRPYADFVALAEDSTDEEGRQTSWNYWKTKLASPLPILTLPTDKPRPLFQTFAGANVDFILDEDLSRKIGALAKRQGCTPFMLLLAAYQTLLYRYTGATDICIGCPTAGRPNASFETTVGYFVNPVVVRNQPRPDLAFIEFLDQVKDTVTGALTHANLPLQTLIERLSPARDRATPPLFQTMFTVKRAHRLADSAGFVAGDANAAKRLGKLLVRPYPLPCLGSQVDLTLTIVEVDGKMAARFEYNPDLFDETTICRMGEHFRTILGSVVAAPKTHLALLEMMPPQERAFVGGDVAPLISEPQGGLHSHFEQQVDLQPAVVALVTPSIELTYSELNIRANRIAHGLIASRLDTSRPLVIMTDTQALQIEAMLGAMKAGHPFLCVDPAYPPLRMGEIFADAAPCAMITDQAAVKRHHKTITMLANQTCEVFVVDGESRSITEPPLSGHYYRPDWEHLPHSNPNRPVIESAPAYIVYTSGSTGTPKGIVQSHAAFVQFLRWQSRTFEIKAPARIANWSSIVYDASYCEIFGALCFGATLCMTATTIRYNPEQLISWLHSQRISLLQTVPSFFRLLLQTLEQTPSDHNPFPALERILLAGEELRYELIAAWRSRFGTKPALWNLYGPTECVLATFHPVQKLSANHGSVPIGRAIDGRQILIVNESGELCPIGVPGEIYIRSPYLSYGYFRSPEQTSQSFVPNPRTRLANDIVFRTRDLGRWLADGTIEFLGRVDGLLKIRGMRVESGEIEAQISRHEAIREAAVSALPNADGELRLVAWIVSTAPLDTATLRAFLKPSLPDHMLPDVVMHIDHMPRTITNKIDRKSLPKPDLSRPVHSESRKPRTALEIEIAALWSHLLRIDTVGIDTSFFELGGHSLLATQLMNRVRSSFGVEVSLKEFFESPTVAGVAAAIERAQLGQQSTSDSLDQLVDKLNELSEDQVMALLEKVRANRTENP